MNETIAALVRAGVEIADYLQVDEMLSLTGVTIPIPIDSHQISGVSYRPDGGELHLTIRGDGYTFYDVPADVVAGFATAGSPTRFFSHNIAKHYASSRG